MKGLIVDINNNNVKEKAKQFARLIYKLSRPDYNEDDVTKYFWKLESHKDGLFKAMMFDENYQIPLNILDDQGNYKPRVVALIQELADLLGYSYTQAKNFVDNNNSFTVEQILNPKLPINGIEIKTYSQMENDGWFNE